MRRAVVAAIIAGIVALIPAHVAFAHVLITDTTGTYGAILHVDPDDNPVAGQTSTLYLDTQALTGSVSLTITSNTSSVVLAMHSSGSMSEAHYIFPSQGVYNLVFTVHSSHDTYQFKQSQLVSRGTVSQPLQTPHYEWARALLVGCIVVLALLLVIALGNRHEIARQSTY